MIAHTSNYKVGGFTESVDIKELDNRESRVYLSMINKYDNKYD